jgi:23S rRNA (cytosine1962-C5)-methyltransferase
MPSVTLAKPLERALRAGHPWIFRDALSSPTRLPDGALVTVLSRAGRPLATGFWDARSPIAVRVLDTAPVPDPDALLRARLRDALARRLAWLDLARTNAFRWAHGEADRLPGIHVDVYDRVAVVRTDGAGAELYYRDAEAALLAEGAGLPIETVVRRDGDAAARAIVVRENGVLFSVRPGAGGKGGLFLDQRDNRAAVERLARGRAVLNLFAASGGFSLYAVRGGAASTDTLDAARPAIEAARANFRLNGFPLDNARFHVADAFEFLEGAARARRRWELVISDPPSFAPSRASVSRARRAYFRLHRLAATVTERGGILCASSCSSHYSKRDLLESVREGARAAGRRFVLEEVRGAGRDHPVAAWFPEGDYLKFAVGVVT